MEKNDTYAYLEWFTYGVEMIYTQFEWLYSFMNKIAINYNLPYETVQMAMACITFTFLYLTFKSQKLNILLAFAFYYLLCDYFRSFNIMRQMTAGAVVMYAISCLKNKENLKFFILVFFASGLHATSFLVLLLYFLRKESNEISQKMVFTVLTITFIAGAINLFKPIVDMLGAYIPRYVTGEANRLETFSISKLFMNLLFMYLYHLMDRKSIFVKSMFIGLCIMNTITFNVDMMRIIYYFLSSQIIIFSQLLYQLNVSKKDKYIISAYSLFTFVYLVLYGDMSGVLEYKMINSLHYCKYSI